MRNYLEVGHILGDIVRSERENMGLSKKKFSDIAGVARSTISNIEAGLPSSLDTLYQITDGLGMSWEKLGREIDSRKSGIKKEVV
jgi:transcriptional regulator with XRE-family HTH domain